MLCGDAKLVNTVTQLRLSNFTKKLKIGKIRLPVFLNIGKVALPFS